MPAIRVLELTQTCPGGPSQWEGRTEEGLVVYVRYRWGCLSIGYGATLEEAVRNTNNLFEKQLGDKLDSTLQYNQLRHATTGLIEWPENFHKRCA